MTDMKAFTLRIPAELADQIQARAVVNHRDRNKEIHALLEFAIDSSVNSDLRILRKPSNPSPS